MLIRVLTLRFSPVFDSFDDTQLTEFIKDKSVVSLPVLPGCEIWDL